MKRPLRNLLSLLVGDIGSRVLGLLITIYLARTLEVSAFGVINIGIGVLGYLMFIASPGIQLLETRNAAAQSSVDPKRVNSVVSLRLVLSVVVIAVTAVLSGLLVQSHETRMSIILFSLSLVPLSLFLDWFFQGKEEFVSVSVARLLNAVMYGGCILVAVNSPSDLLWVPFGFAVGSAAATIFLLTRYRSFGKLSFAWEPTQWKNVLRGNVPVGISMFLAQSTMNLPVIAIGWLISTADAGIFSAALKVVFALLMLDRILNALLLPAATRYFSQRTEDANRFLMLITRIVVVALIPVTIIGVLLAPDIIRTVFGDRFDAAAFPLQLLMGYFFFTVLNSVFVCGLIAVGREDEYTHAINIGSVVSICCIIGGAAFVGIPGVALGVVLGELVTVVLTATKLAKFVKLHISPSLARLFASGFVLVIVLFVLRNEGGLISVSFGLLGYMASLLSLRALTKDDLRFLRERFV